MSEPQVLYNQLRRSGTDDSDDNEDVVDAVEAVVVDEEQSHQVTHQPTTDHFGQRCCVRYCKNPSSRQQPLFRCAAPDCIKFLHMCCYVNKVRCKNSFDLLDVNKVVCRKQCYSKATKASLSWHNDGCKGVHDPNSSVGILINWLTTEGNYSRIWKGKHNGGRTKDNIAETIANLINAANVNTDAIHPTIVVKNSLSNLLPFLYIGPKNNGIT
jgi:hypothetical protein